MADKQIFQLDNKTIQLTDKIPVQDKDGIEAAKKVTVQDIVDQVVFPTGQTIYNLESPAAIAVGGIDVGYTLTGKTSNEIIQDLLVPTLFPSFTNPDNTFVDNATNTLEVGVTASTITFTASFNRGLISPAYGTSGFRSGLPSQYNYSNNGNVNKALPATSVSSLLSDAQSLTNVEILAGSNSWSNTVSYSAGEQPKDSKGNDFSTPLPAGTTVSKSVTVTGIYPWFYGKSSGASRPVAGSALIASGIKVVTTSIGTVNAPFNTTGTEWTWIAIPSTSTSKSRWYVTALSNGIIGGTFPSGNKYPQADVVSVDSPTALWNGISYKFYISEAQSVETNVEFRNS